MEVQGPEDNLWLATTTDDLVDINRYARDKILSSQIGRFYPIQGRWFDPFGPGISDGRYVFKTLFLSKIIFQENSLKLSYSRHRLLPNSFEPPTGEENSLSGCSGLGVDTEHNYGLVYKAVGIECGIYRSYDKGQAPKTYVSHRLVDKHAYNCKYIYL